MNYDTVMSPTEWLTLTLFIFVVLAKCYLFLFPPNREMTLEESQAALAEHFRRELGEDVQVRFSADGSQMFISRAA